MTELIRTPLEATVTSFDPQVGLGEVETDDGTVYGFHCIVIVDGSRHIDVGTRVAFEPLAKLGRWEASAIRPI
jgi:cold shock CspA family protein